jgi:hypothetical protein
MICQLTGRRDKPTPPDKAIAGIKDFGGIA